MLTSLGRPKSNFIKSSARICTKPGYYLKIINRLTPIRDELLNAAEAKGDVYTTDKESEERKQADKLTAKIRWAISRHKSQLIMLRESRASHE